MLVEWRMHICQTDIQFYPKITLSAICCSKEFFIKNDFVKIGGVRLQDMLRYLRRVI